MEEEMIDTYVEGQAITEGTFGFTISDGDGNAYAFDLETGAAVSLGTIRSQTISGPDLLPALEDDQEIEGIATVPIGDVVEGQATEFTLVGVSEANNGPGLVVRDIQAPPEQIIGVTQGRIGTEAGAAYDPTTSTVFNVQSDDEADPLVTALYRIPIEPPTDENGDIIDGPLVEELVGTTEGIYVDGLAIDSEGNAFASDFRLTDSLYSVDLETGDLSLVGSFDLDFDVDEDSGLDFAPDGTLYGITEDSRLYTIDTETGAATFVNEIIDVATGELVPADIEGFAIADAATLSPLARVESDNDISEIPQEVLDANGLNIIDTEGIDISDRRFSFNDGEGILIAGDGSVSLFSQIEANSNGGDGTNFDGLVDRAEVTIGLAEISNNGDAGVDISGIENAVDISSSELLNNEHDGLFVSRTGVDNTVSITSTDIVGNGESGIEVRGENNDFTLSDVVFRNNGTFGLNIVGDGNTFEIEDVGFFRNGSGAISIGGDNNVLTITDSNITIDNIINNGLNNTITFA